MHTAFTVTQHCLAIQPYFPGIFVFPILHLLLCLQIPYTPPLPNFPVILPLIEKIKTNQKRTALICLLHFPYHHHALASTLYAVTTDKASLLLKAKPSLMHWISSPSYLAHGNPLSLLHHQFLSFYIQVYFSISHL